MGTDIHSTFEKKVDDEWVEIDLDYDDYDSPYYLKRHYLLFSVLADVRNGYGFAGCKTYDPVIPISEPRGLPPEYKSNMPVGWEDNFKWGEHSQSWLLGSEILDYFNNPQSTKREGIITAEQRKDWDGVSRPDDWCGDAFGSGIEVCYDPELSLDVFYEGYTHYRVKWNTDILDELGYFKDLIQELVDEHGEIRMVFGFDS